MNFGGGGVGEVKVPACLEIFCTQVCHFYMASSKVQHSGYLQNLAINVISPYAPEENLALNDHVIS